MSFLTASGPSASICSLESVVHTPSTRMPAALAAETPAGASSITTQFRGSVPTAAAAARNASGAGLSRSNGAARGDERPGPRRRDPRAAALFPQGREILLEKEPLQFGDVGLRDAALLGDAGEEVCFSGPDERDEFFGGDAVG